MSGGPGGDGGGPLIGSGGETKGKENLSPVLLVGKCRKAIVLVEQMPKNPIEKPVQTKERASTYFRGVSYSYFLKVLLQFLHPSLTFTFEKCQTMYQMFDGCHCTSKVTWFTIVL